jgi:hypothetical protein
MSRLLLYTIVFIEGFCSLGAEVIALRRLVPHIGSSIVVTAPTIGFFLLALALGYAAGAKVTGNYTAIVARNFLIAAALAGVGLAGVSVDWMFAHLQPVLVAYLFFIGGVLCPLAWLLGQTVPILTNLMKHARTGEASGLALYWSTLGSFLGSVSLSLLVMQWLGVSAAVFACALGLVIGSLLLAQRNAKIIAFSLSTAALAAGFNLQHEVTADTAYAEYIVGGVTLTGQQNPRAFWVNKSTASLIDESEPPNYTRYIKHLRQILLDDLGFRDKEILVLGAGGFTLSHREPLNRYTYVDIDPAIREHCRKALSPRRHHRRVHRRRCPAFHRHHRTPLRCGAGRCLQFAHLDPQPSGDPRILGRHPPRPEAGRRAARQPDSRRQAGIALRPQFAGDHRKRIRALRGRRAAQGKTGEQCRSHLFRQQPGKQNGHLR